jgi:peptidoglycan/xylan/chitin deacetylase (PgdA/CDA1 family)
MDDSVVYNCKDPRIMTHVESTVGEKVVAKPILLTFDDGPSRQLEFILDILKKHHVPALFFWQTKLFYPERPWQRLINEGHVIGSHTSKHPNLNNYSAEQQRIEIKNSVTKIERTTGKKVGYFRPPFGQYNEDTLTILEELQLTPILWHVSGMDWNHKEDPMDIVYNILDHVEEGSIILLHELRQTVTVLEHLILQLKKEGYQFVAPSTAFRLYSK